MLKNGKKLKMSTRKANFITMDELIKEVGSDVIRYFFIMRSMNTHLDFDINVAKDQSEKILSIIYNMLMLEYQVFCEGLMILKLI